MSAFGGKADNRVEALECPLLTQSGHERRLTPEVNTEWGLRSLMKQRPNEASRCCELLVRPLLFVWSYGSAQWSRIQREFRRAGVSLDSRQLRRPMPVLYS